MPRKRKQPFTDGEIHKIIDSVLHPMAKTDIRYWAVDTAFHAIVEQNPQLTAQKFLHYTLPKLVEQYAKELRRGRSR